MPPLRTMSFDKPVKTERTHEENQERAYIAASRRSDRSLEARVESARRASEIHKRRTGRSLRVTEQDVVNEEMYEEEDDDLPMQYRRLTAHLHTNSSDFNRRLAAYLTNQVAMRTAIDQAMSNAYGPNHLGNPNYTQTSQLMQQPSFPTPILPQHMMFQSPVSPTSPTSASSYRTAPYTIPQTPQASHQRAASVAGPVDVKSEEAKTHTDKPTDCESQRRSSAPAKPPTPISTLSTLEQRSSTMHNDSSASAPANTLFSPQQMDFSPFSTTLPYESQQMLGNHLDPNDPFSYSLMGGNGGPQQPFYSYNPNQFTKSRNFHPSYDGMNQTLAPGALDTATDTMSPAPSSVPPPSNAIVDNFESNFAGDVFNEGFLSSSFSDAGSGRQTPSERDWSSYIDTSWNETT